jgi:hypothetical protein
MGHTLRGNRLHIRAINTPCPSTDWRVILCRRRGLRDPEDVCPLFDGFDVVVIVQDLVIGAVPELDLRTGASVPGVGVAHHIAPFLAGLDVLALRAPGVPQAAVMEATEGHTCEGGDASEDIRIDTSEDLCHHGTRGAAGCKDTAGIAGVLLESIFDHVNDGEGVAAAVVSEGLWSVHVPAVSGVWGIGVDDD